MNPEQGQRQEQIQSFEPGEEEKIINFRLSEEDFELAKTIHEDKKSEFLEWLEERRVEIPTEREELIYEANQGIQEVLGKYNIDLPDKVYETTEVHPLYAADYKEATGEERRGAPQKSVGSYLVEKNKAIIWYAKTSFKSEELRNVEFLHNATHELTHAKAYIALQAFKEKEGVKPVVQEYRGGLTVVKLGSPRTLFHEFNEAITETLAGEVTDLVVNQDRERFKPLIIKQILEKVYRPYHDNPVREKALEMGYIKEELYREEIGFESGRLKRSTEKLKDLSEFAEKMFAGDYEYELPALDRPYSKERKLLQQIIGSIPEKNIEYENKEDDVKAIIYESYFTGRMLKLGRLIEKTFGKGTFRMIAEKPFSSELQERLK